MISDSISRRMNGVFNGNPAHGGASLIDSLKHISNYNHKIGGSHSIGQIVEHLSQWKNFAIEKIKGNESFNIEIDSKADWNHDKIYTSEEIESQIKQLIKRHQTLVSLISAKEDQWFKQRVHGEKYTFGGLLEALLQHDIYHCGQITMLGKE